MTLNKLLRGVEKFLGDNSPTILTAIGVTGTVTTAFLTGRAAIQANEILFQKEVKHGKLTWEEKTRLVWTLYIPPVGMGVLTIASIIFANRIGMRRAAAMAAAYSVSERAFAEYKEKVIERMGDRKETSIRDEIAQERVARTPNKEILMFDEGKVLCFDTMSGRYFESDMERLRKAQNDINYQILNDTYATLHDFYNAVGLPPTKYSSEVGWSSSQLLDLKFSTCLSENNRPCITIEYSSYPIRDYYHE